MKITKKLWCALLAVLVVLSMTCPMALAADEYYLTWDEYKEANGIESWDYNLQAKVIAEVANHAVELYAAGENDEAYEYAKATYWGYYEVSGFERNTMNYISGSRVSEVELGFTTLRKAVKKDQGVEAAQAAADALIEMLVTDGAILSPEGAAAQSTESTDAAPAAGFEYTDGYLLTWDEFKEVYGITTWNYNDQAVVISDLANHAVELYAAGETDEAYEYAKATYWGYYEVSGFERNTMNYISGSRVSEVELGFTTLRKAVKKDLGVEAAQEAADALSAMLVTDGLILSPEGPTFTAAESAETGTSGTAQTQSGTSVGSAIAVFLGSFAIILREGLEAILIVGAMVAYLVKTENKKGTRYVYGGAVIALVASVALAILLYSITSSTSNSIPQEIVEGVTALIAVAVLIYVSNWMISKAESEQWTKYISDKASDSANKNQMFSLGFTSFLAVFREGAEVILFCQQYFSRAGSMDNGYAAVFGGVVAGLAVVVLIFALIRVFGVKIPLKPFFMATSILMAVMSIAFLGSGMWELFLDGGLAERMGGFVQSLAGTIPALAWMSGSDTLAFFGIYPTWITLLPQLILLAITVITFVITIRRGSKSKKQQAEA